MHCCRHVCGSRLCMRGLTSGCRCRQDGQRRHRCRGGRVQHQGRPRASGRQRHVVVLEPRAGVCQHCGSGSSGLVAHHALEGGVAWQRRQVAVLARLPALEDGCLPWLDGRSVRQVERVVGIELLWVAAPIAAGLARKAGEAVCMDGHARRCNWPDVERGARHDRWACEWTTRKERGSGALVIGQMRHNAPQTAQYMAGWVIGSSLNAMCALCDVVTVPHTVHASGCIKHLPSR